MKQLFTALKRNPQFLISLFGFITINAAIISITYVYILKTEALHYQQMYRQLQSINDIKEHGLRIFFTHRIADIQALASNETVPELLRQYTQADSRDAERTHLRYLYDFLKEHAYSNTMLIDANSGKVLFATAPWVNPGIDLTTPSMAKSSLAHLWRRVVEKGKTQIGDLHIDRHFGTEPSMFLATPIQKEGALAAVLVLQLPGSAINEILHFTSNLGRTGESYAVGQDYLMRSDSTLEPRRFSVAYSLMHPTAASIHTEAVDQALSGQKGSDLITDYRGKRVLSAYAPFHLSDFTWALMTEIDQEELDAQIAATQMNVYLWAALISLTITALAYFFIRKIIRVSVIGPLERNHQRAKSFEEIINNSLNEIYIFNTDDLRFRYVNRGAMLNTGYTLEEMQSMTPLGIKPTFSKEHFLRTIAPLLEHRREQIAFKTVHERKDGSRYDVDIRLQLMPIEGEAKFVAIVNDITEHNRALQDKKHYYELSTHDHLTQLYNRQKFDELFRKELERARRYGNDLALILFDIDHFKQINDSHGHPGGDIVLQKLSRFVETRLRSSDIFARWGGEEFAVLMPHSDRENAQAKAQELRIGIEALSIDDAIRRVTCSFGVVSATPSDTAASMFEKADIALYRAKAEGRNRVVIFDSRS